MTTRRALERYSALVVLEDLLEAGLTVEADRPHLRIRPAGDLPDDLRDEAVRLKPYILEVLDPPAPDAPCPGCGERYYGRRPLSPWMCLGCGELETEELADVVRAESPSDGRVQTSAASADGGAHAVQ